MNKQLAELNKDSLKLVLELRSSGTKLKTYDKDLLEKIFNQISILNSKYKEKEEVPKLYIQILFFLESQFRGNANHCENSEQLNEISYRFNDSFRAVINTE